MEFFTMKMKAGKKSTRRLHSAIGYVTPRARLEGWHVGI